MHVSVNVDIHLSNTFALFPRGCYAFFRKPFVKTKTNPKRTRDSPTCYKCRIEQDFKEVLLESTYHFLLEVREMCSAAAVQQDLEGAQLLVDDGGLRIVQEAEACYHIAQH